MYSAELKFANIEYLTNIYKLKLWIIESIFFVLQIDSCPENDEKKLCYECCNEGAAQTPQTAAQLQSWCGAFVASCESIYKNILNAIFDVDTSNQTKIFREDPVSCIQNLKHQNSVHIA